MTTTATIELSDWSGEYGRAVQELKKKTADVATRTRNKLWLAQRLWSCYSDLKGLIRAQDAFVKKYSGLDLKIESADLSGIVESSMNLHRTIHTMVATLTARGFGNTTFIGACMDAMRGASASVLDFAELLDVSSDSGTRESLAEAQEAFDRGDIFLLA
jgi:hypothetical protein